jgi:hypothetical protein
MRGRGESRVREEGEEGSFYRRGGGRPKGGVRQPLGENLLLFMVVNPLHGGNPLINMR